VVHSSHRRTRKRERQSIPPGYDRIILADEEPGSRRLGARGYAMDNDLTLKAAALKLGFVTEVEFDRVVDPEKMVKPYVAAAAKTAA
jgi:hypothetical protein